LILAARKKQGSGTNRGLAVWILPGLNILLLAFGMLAVPDGLPPWLASLVWDVDWQAPILLILVRTYLSGFLLELLVPLAVLALIGRYALLPLMLSSRGKKALSVVSYLLLAISAIPVFILARLGLLAPEGTPAWLPIALLGLVGNTVIFVFIREQIEFLNRELQADYLVAAMARQAAYPCTGSGHTCGR
jgi:hypothetical protein